MVTICTLMVTNMGRNDTAVRMSRWLDDKVEAYVADRKNKVTFPSKRNFVDIAVMQLLQELNVDLAE